VRAGGSALVGVSARAVIVAVSGTALRDSSDERFDRVVVDAVTGSTK
jgi:hypothetical protein